MNEKQFVEMCIANIEQMKRTNRIEKDKYNAVADEKYSMLMQFEKDFRHRLAQIDPPLNAPVKPQEVKEDESR